jgi:hypothetical protein
VTVLKDAATETAIGESVLTDAETKVQTAIETYGQFITNLTLVITSQLLTNENIKFVREFLSHRDEWVRHKMYSKTRIPNSGNWFVEDEVFKNWETGTSRVLVCPGIGLFPGN